MRLVREHVTGNAIEVLPIEPEHLDEQRKLPFHHRDPFDRLIISQATVEELEILTRDAAFTEYEVNCTWKPE